MTDLAQRLVAPWVHVLLHQQGINWLAGPLLQHHPGQPSRQDTAQVETVCSAVPTVPHVLGLPEAFTGALVLPVPQEPRSMAQ